MPTGARPAGSADAAFADALRARGYRATPQRVILHRVLQDIDGHVTADELLAWTAARLPSVSLPTIYAALGVLEEMGEVRRVSALGGTTVYDTRRRPHHHVVCRVCGRLEDLDVKADTDAVVRAAKARGYRAPAAQVTVQGLCARCAALSPAPPQSATG